MILKKFSSYDSLYQLSTAFFQKNGILSMSHFKSHFFYLSMSTFNRVSISYRTRVRSLATLVSDSLTNSLTDCRLVNLFDVTLACEDGNSKLVEVVTVVDVDDEDNVSNSLLQI